MKHVIIVGGGVSAWCAANAFSANHISVTVIFKNKKVFGAQQISPNGMKALINITGDKKIQDKIHKISQIKINLIKNSNLKTLSNFDLSKKFPFYGSISRQILLNTLKKSALNNKNVKIINDEVKHILKVDDGVTQVLTSTGKSIKSNVIIGADGVNGICRKFVCGNEKLICKNIFRSTSTNKTQYMLTKNLLQIFLTKHGHYVVYPFKSENQNFVNYVFTPNKIFQKNFKFSDMSEIHPLLEIDKWELTSPSFTNESTSIFKHNVFLFGDSAMSIEPHLAQAGNQILEDAVFLKKTIRNQNKPHEIFESFVENRMIIKNQIKKHSMTSGKILGLKDYFSLPRNFFISKFSKIFFDQFFKSLWTFDETK